MAALVGSYTFDLERLAPMTGVSIGPDIARSVLWTFVHQLTGQLSGLTHGVWTVEGSGNGKGVSGGGGAMDGVNRWWNGGVFNKDLMGYSSTGPTDGNWGAWIVLRAPSNFPGSTRPSLLLTLTPPDSAAAGIDVRTYVTNGVFTGGAMATVPTTTSPLITAQTVYYNWLLSLVYTADTTVRKCHLALASDGAFFWSCSKAGTARIFNAMAFIPLLDAVAGDANPWVFFRGGPDDVADTMPSISGMQEQWGKSAWSLYHFIRGPNSSYGCFSINKAGTAVVTTFPTLPLSHSVGANGFMTLPRRMSLDTARQLYPEFPIWIHDSQPCSRGRLRDI